MLFTILPAALLALSATAGGSAVPSDPNDGMRELDRVVPPRAYWDASLAKPDKLRPPRVITRITVPKD